MINWNDIDLKGKTSGQFKTKCPACIDRRTNKRDKSLSVNISKGVANCHYCEEFSILDVKEKTEIEYKLPVQSWKNYTSLSENMVKFFEKRGISQSTLIENHITQEDYYQPQAQKSVSNVVFNYFEGNVLINKKYRSSGKHFTQSAGTKNIFYGINDVIGKKEVYLVEGEMDKLALYEIGVKNAISVPNGANDNDDVWQNCESYLSDVKMFYIAVDCDTKGNELAEKVAQRLGRWRCQRVRFKNKDANDDLIEGRDVLEASLKNLEKYPVSGTYRVSDMMDKMIDLYDNGLPPTIYPKKSYFGGLKNIFTVMMGHLCVITGIPSHGKSNFLEWYVLNLAEDYGYKASFFSPEHQPLEMHQSTFVEKAIGKNYWREVQGVPRVTKDEIGKYQEWAEEKIYLTSPEDGEFPTWEWLLLKMKEQMFSFGVNIFVIDAFNKLDFNNSKSERDNIKQILTKLTMFAQLNNVIVFLVAHPTKMQKNDQGLYRMPTLYDVSGSADFRNQTHDGFCIYRYFDSVETNEQGYNVFVNLKTKMNFQGEIGGVQEFDYHLPSGRFYAKNTHPPLNPIFEIENEIIPLITPEQAFDIDEVPF